MGKRLDIVAGQAVLDWMNTQGSEFGGLHGVGIGLVRDGKYVAGVAYTDFNGVNLYMHVAAVGKDWLNRRYLWTCFDYPFNQIKVKRVTGLVGEGNLAARRFDEHLGFSLETTLSDAHPTGDLLVYRMYRDECRWISPDFVRQLAKAA